MLARHFVAGVREDGRALAARCDLLAAVILLALLVAFLAGARL